MKLLNLDLTANEHTSSYYTLSGYVNESVHNAIVPKQEIIDKGFIVELRIEYKGDDSHVPHKFTISSHSTQSLMDWVKENHPDLYPLIPELNSAVFDFLGKSNKASTHLTLKSVELNADLEFEFGEDPEADEFIPKRDTVEESFNEIRGNGFYTRLQGYPETPIGFWAYNGLDFKSLFNRVVHLD